MIVTQTTGAIEYSVSGSVEEKGTIDNKKKLSVHIWSVCEELAIIHEESKSSTNKQSLWIYSIVHFDEDLASCCNLWNV